MARKFRERFKTENDVFDQFTIRNLFELSSHDYFEEDSMIPISLGKEANTFAATRGEEKVVIKIYRLETSDFKRMYEYIKPDPRYQDLAKQKREIVFAWAQREYRNLLIAREAKVRAPIPIKFMKNILIMSFIGSQTPAPALKDAVPKDPKTFLKDIIENMKKLYKAGYVHGDLSKFNILNDDERAVLIDFSQCSPVRSPLAREMLERDCKNIADYFERLGVKTSAQAILKKVV